jgi:hypothetical protein
LEPRFPFGEFADGIAPRSERRWWAQPNNTVAASVRLNVADRESAGRIATAKRRDAARWLAARLREVVNLDTGEPIVAAVLETDDYYERYDGDAFGDLIVEWNRSTPMTRVWSPATGVVFLPERHARSGDHHPRGLLLASGPGIQQGRRAAPLEVVHIAPTLAASVGIEMPDVDGRVVWELVPEHARRGADRGEAGRQLRDRPAGRVARAWSSTYELTELERIDRRVRGLMATHHETWTSVHDARRELAKLPDVDARIHDLERAASIATTSAWLRQVDVPPSLLVSVVTPTRNRSARLRDAIASVQAQRYVRWEMLVVDDGSSDDTPAVLAAAAAHDDRIRPLRIAHAGPSPARNHALDHARGDVIVYLDDDNRFDPDWLRSVVWAFTNYPDTAVCYGARVVDDFDRHHSGQAGGLPWVQFLAWDREAVEEFNRVDMNVLAHRPSEARFDSELDYYSDWDLLLKVTDGADPLELPVVAVYYTTDASNRLSGALGTAAIDLQYEHVRETTAQRRSLS